MTRTNVSEATAAESWSIPELAASAAERSAVFRLIEAARGQDHRAKRTEADNGRVTRAFRRVRRITLPLYVGGFLGPFGGAMLVALAPNVAEGSARAEVAQVAAAITAYMVRLRRSSSSRDARRAARPAARRPRRVRRLRGGRARLRAGAGDLVLPRGARGDGRGERLPLPILLAALSEVVALPCWAERSDARGADGRLLLAPILGGLLGEISWRLAFVLVALSSPSCSPPRQTLGAAERSRTGGQASISLAPQPLDRAPRHPGRAGLPGLHRDRLRARPRRRGGVRPRGRAPGPAHRRYGIGGILLGRYAGTVVDRAGRPATALAGAVACTAGVLGARRRSEPLEPRARLLRDRLRLCVRLGRTEHDRGRVLPGGRAGATSAYSAFKFAGVAIAQLVYVPLFNVDTRLPFLLAAGFSALLAVSIATRPGSVATGEAPDRRPRPGAGRLLQGHDPPARPRARRQRLGAEHLGGDGGSGLRGPPDAVERLVDFVHSGPSGALVEHVDVFEEDEEGLTGFSIG